MDSFVAAVYRINDYLNAFLWQGVPDVAKGIIISLVFAYVFRKQIKKHPVIFYIYPTLTFLWFTFYGVVTLLPGDLFEQWGLHDSWISKIGWLPYGLGLVTPIGIGFITIVMFVGVLPQKRFVVEFLKIRSEMAIIGSTILVAHGIMRLGTAVYYLKGEHGTDFNLYVLCYGILGPVILALIILPWLTSFKVIRRRMRGRTWKVLQTYLGVPLFVGMLIFGFILTLAWSVGDFPGLVNMWEIVTYENGDPISLGTGINVATNLLASRIYFVLLAFYTVLRVKKVKKNRQRKLAIAVMERQELSDHADVQERNLAFDTADR
jgi:DMSO/TMAO reductase YedYZ heme-binding membrane subunit